MCFLDLTGYTRLTEERGDEAAADLAARLAGLVRRSSQEHDGMPVKWLGDGVMFYFREPAAAVLAALEMVELVGSQGLPPAHVGVHAGPVVFQEGDYFGRTVNLAARIAEYARPGEVLVSQEVVDAANAAPVAFNEIGLVDLKGFPGSFGCTPPAATPESSAAKGHSLQRGVGRTSLPAAMAACPPRSDRLWKALLRP
jgi:adenylate cyclase